ncbi:MAG: AMP-binding protein [Acholeplasmataceae bacterium]|nr:AMP-binding protein [Acholeplasmataceae bacterium]
MKKLSEHQLSFLHANKYYGKEYPSNVGGVLHLYSETNLNHVKKAVENVLDQVDFIHYKFVEENNQFYQYLDKKPIVFDYCEFKDRWDDTFIAEYFNENINPQEKSYKVMLVSVKDYISIVFVLHHLVCDGYTMNLLATKLLNSLNNKPDFNFSSYDNYLKREQDYLTSKQFFIDKNYWNKFSIKQETYAKPSCISKDLETIINVKHALTPAETELIDQFISVYGGSPQILFELILAIELSVVNSSDTVTLGITSHNRKKNEKDIGGMLVATLPLSIDINPTDTFLEAYKKNIMNHLKTYRHQMYPYKDILKSIHNKGIKQLFDVMVIYLTPFENDYDGNYKLETLHNKKSVLSTLLYIEKRTPENVYLLSFAFKESVFNHPKERNDYVNRVMNRLKNILKNPTSKISALIETETLNSLTASNKNVPRLLDLFNQQVNSNLNKIALIDANHHLSYNELDEKSDQVSFMLQKAGINKQVIQIDLSDKINRIIALMGVLKSNNTYTFLPENLTDSVKEIYQSVAGVTYVINDSFFTDNKPFQENPFIRDNTVLGIYFTSGSTGHPKAVQVDEIGIVNYCLQQHHYQHDLKELNTVLNLASFNFDISLENIFLSLLLGKTLTLGDLNNLNQPHLLNNDFLSTTPSILQLIIKYQPEILTSLKVIVSGGEILGKSLVNALRKVSNATVYNSYGPTEASIAVTSTPVFDEEITLGKPFDGCSVEIKNENFINLPNGYIGEIVLSGICLSSGYTKDYQPSGFMTINGTNYYKTGDFGYIDHQDNLVFVGRKDKQIKKNGIRIDIEQVDKILLNHPNVIQSKTIVSNDDVHTYLVCKDETVKSIYNYLKKKLPNIYLPSQIHITNDILLNDSGKTKLVLVDTINKKVYNPKSDTEKVFIEKLKEVFKIDNLYEDDTIYDFGVDSIDVLTLMFELNEIGIDLPLTIFNETPRIVDSMVYLNETPLKHPSPQQHSLINHSEHKPIKHLLLLGSTGFLGSHVLYYLLKETNLHISVMIRSHQHLDGHAYLLDTFNYYFNETLDIDRVKVYVSEITEPNFGLNLNTYNDLLNRIDAVINCAGKVDFVGKETDFIPINVDLVNSLITFSNLNKIPIFHASTIGLLLAEKRYVDEDQVLSQRSYSNYYLKTKRLAEDLLLECKKTYNIPIYILRIGNLMPRYSDLKFQRNKENNAIYQLVKRLNNQNKSLTSNYEIDISPVDFIAQIIIKIVMNQPKLINYHLYVPSVLTIYPDLTYDFTSSYKLISQSNTLSELKKYNISFKKVSKQYIKRVILNWKKTF